ncbi:patatin-like phospholipase family protein [Sphingomonas sp. 22R3R2A-7]|uniref:patatin-like phospholipase family protein n=1 Tax=Sphingomonas sp. 22R3R2A-7 TaxID=3050230 RepID=UPI002FE42062
MREKELRLALVCYGGISLAVYMHGITKEIWHLVRASHGHHDGSPRGGGSQAVYRDLLEEIEAQGELRVRVLADIIAGASAGGINGIFLAQAISTGQSLDPLTDLWLSSADVEALIDLDRSAAVAILEGLGAPACVGCRGAHRRQGPDARRFNARGGQGEAVALRPLALVRAAIRRRDLYRAAARCVRRDGSEHARAATASPGQPLDLYVTVTDFTGHPERLKLNSPPEVVETEHRVVVDFSDHGIATDSLADIPELAFAARATSSFPGRSRRSSSPNSTACSTRGRRHGRARPRSSSASCRVSPRPIPRSRSC